MPMTARKSGPLKSGPCQPSKPCKHTAASSSQGGQGLPQANPSPSPQPCRFWPAVDPAWMQPSQQAPSFPLWNRGTATSAGMRFVSTTTQHRAQTWRSMAVEKRRMERQMLHSRVASPSMASNLPPSQVLSQPGLPPTHCTAAFRLPRCLHQRLRMHAMVFQRVQHC